MKHGYLTTLRILFFVLLFSSFANAQTLKLLSLTGGETINGCSTQKISWNSQFAGARVRLEFSQDAGASWIFIAETNNATGNNSYDWIVPNINSNKIRVRVFQQYFSIELTDYSKSNITISTDNSKKIVLTYPNGGDHLASGSMQTIRWNTTGSNKNVSLRYSVDGGLSWQFMNNGFSENVPNTGSYKWIIPDQLPQLIYCMVQVYETADPCVTDYNDSFFKISPYPALVIANPSEGDTLYVANTYAVSVVRANLPSYDVNIHYSIDNGTTWKFLGVIGANAYDWTIPDEVTNTGKLRATLVSDNTIQNIISFKIVKPLVKIIKPVGGENFSSCSNINISWVQKGFLNKTKLDYSTNGGTTWLNIDSVSSVKDSNQYTWTVPNIATTNARIRIRNADIAKVADSSLTAFTITGDASRTITLTSPNGGESWASSSWQTVTWSSTSNVGNVSIQYSLDGGLKWQFIAGENLLYASNIANTGSFKWIVPEGLLPASKCLIKIYETAKPCIIDYSNAYFSINSTPSIAILKPLTDEPVYCSNQYSIFWIGSNLPTQRCNLEFSSNNGSSWIMLDSNNVMSPFGVSSFSWTVPANPTNQAVLRVTATNNTSIKSEVHFKIALPYITLTRPVGADTLKGCSTDTIAWIQHGISNQTLVDYSLDEGKTWIRLANWLNTQEGKNYYNWTPPHTVIKTMRFRVSDRLNNAYADSNKTNIRVTGDTNYYVKISYPNGGESFSPGSVQNISWTKKNVFNPVKIKYSTDGGLSWEDAKDQTGNTAYTYNTTFPWLIPSTITPSTKCFINVFQDECAMDYNDAYFTISDDPAISITYPANKDTLFIGRTYAVTWFAHKTPGDSVLIDYSLDNGTSWNILSSGYYDPSRSYNWTIPNQISNKGILRFRVKNNPAIVNQINFTTALPSLVLTNPVTTELNACTEVEIAWQGKGLSNFVYLDYSVDEGKTWKYIDKHYDRTIKDSYLWNVSNDATDKARIRVRDVNNTSARDSSKANIKIISFSTEAFTITFPNGGEVFSPHSSQQIKWITKDITSDVTVEYSIDNGTTWNTVKDTVGDQAIDLPNKGFCNWLIPDNLPASGSCLVRIYGTGRKCIMDESDAFFSLDRKPNISIIRPSDNVVFYRNQTAYIHWMGFQLPHDSIDLSYSLDNGATWVQLDSNYRSIISRYDWKVPNLLNNQGIFKIQATGAPSIESSIHFKIETPALVLARPNGGETYNACQQKNIVWFNKGAPGYALLDYSFNEGIDWIRLDSVTQVADSNYYLWDVPNMETNKIRVRVSDPSFVAATDFSNGNFSIVQDTLTRLKILSPNGGEAFTSNSLQEVRWVKAGSPNDRVGVSYSLDGGLHWQYALDGTGLPASNIKNTGSFFWWLPEVKNIYSNCLIRMTDPFKPCLRDYSDKFFQIDTIPSVKIYTPQDGDTLYTGRSYGISVTHRNMLYKYVSIDYSLDKGANWTVIQSNYKIETIGNLYVPWNIPNVITNQGILRIRSIANPAVKNEIGFVTAASVLSLINPTGGETFTNCTNASISWKQKGIRGGVRFDYSFDGGLHWLLVDYIPSADGVNQYDWIVPNVATDKLRFRLIGDYSGITRDSTKTNATIIAGTSTLAVTYPIASTSVSSSSVCPITWTSVSTSGNVSVQFSEDGLYWDFARDLNGKIADKIPDNGKFNWLIPYSMKESSSYLVRIYETANPCQVAYSSYFNIKNVATLTLTHPQTNMTWRVGNTYEIKWERMKLPTEFVNLHCSFDNGKTWVKIDSNRAALSTYFWNTPNKASDQCIMRISATADTTIKNLVHFKISSGSSTLKLQTLTGGELLSGCSTAKIKWTQTDSLEVINLDYSLDGGNNWIPLDHSSYKNGIIGYDWKVPNITTNSAKVRIQNYFDPLATDSSKTTFSIVQDPSINLKVLSPNGGESFPAGSLQLIEWETTGSIPKVSLEYSLDAGKTWRYVIDGLHNSASNMDNLNLCYWQVPPDAPISSDCLIRIYKPWTPSSCEIDYSDFHFSTNHDPTIAITKPKPNETRYVGQRYPIQWEKVNTTTEAVTIDYSTDNGTTWTVIDSSDANVYHWLIPNTISDKSVVRVRSKADNTVTSLVKFKIANTVSVQENEFDKNNWNIYPNPTADLLYVDYTADQPINLTIKLMDIKGQLISTESLLNYKGNYHHTFHLNSQKAGMYLLQIITDKEVISRKIIKN